MIPLLHRSLATMQARTSTTEASRVGDKINGNANRQSNLGQDYDGVCMQIEALNHLEFVRMEVCTPNLAYNT